MKTIKGILLVAVMVLSNGVFAGTERASKASAELDVTIEAQIDGRVIVGFEKLAEEKVFVEIFDQDGVKIHVESIKEGTIVLKRFDLEQFPAGDYAYKVSNSIFSIEKVIEKK